MVVPSAPADASQNVSQSLTFRGRPRPDLCSAVDGDVSTDDRSSGLSSARGPETEKISSRRSLSTEHQQETISPLPPLTGLYNFCLVYCLYILVVSAHTTVLPILPKQWGVESRDIALLTGVQTAATMLWNTADNSCNE